MTMDLNGLCQPMAGLMSLPISLPALPGEPQYQISSCLLGDLRHLQSLGDRNYGRPMEMSGAGGDVDPERARIKAMAESLERYCTCVYSDEQFVYASARDLGADALDLDSIPVCSETELNHPKCPLVRPNKDAAMRWVKGVSLTTGKQIWIPSVMVYLYIPYINEAERFWLPISTGCAVHQNYQLALINAINEVVERDAISLTWLHRLSLPELVIDVSTLPPEAREYYRLSMESPYFETHYYDATTDIGIPTIYSVQTAPHNNKAANVVMCTTDLDPLTAFTKITREAASVRIAIQHKPPHQKSLDEFIDVMDGALYMGNPSKSHGFDFLRSPTRVKPLHELKQLSSGDEKEDLRFLIDRLRQLGHEVIAVDLTTDEARRCDMRAVRVVIPTLQPLSFAYRARFLGTKRLWDAPVRMGYGIRNESEINPMPQPFA